MFFEQLHFSTLWIGRQLHIWWDSHNAWSIELLTMQNQLTHSDCQSIYSIYIYTWRTDIQLIMNHHSETCHLKVLYLDCCLTMKLNEIFHNLHIFHVMAKPFYDSQWELQQPMLRWKDHDKILMWSWFILKDNYHTTCTVLMKAREMRKWRHESWGVERWCWSIMI